MQRLLAITAAAMAFAVTGLAQAATVYAPGSAICSGEFSTDTSGDVSLFCMGDLTLSGGEIVSDTKLNIFSVGSISLDDIRLVAGEITLFTMFSSIYVSDKVVFDSVTGQQPSLLLGNLTSVYTPPLTVVESAHTGYGTVTATLTFTPRPTFAVPEPSTWALMLAGVAMLGALRRR